MWMIIFGFSGTGCHGETDRTPSPPDDPAHWDPRVVNRTAFPRVIGEMRWVVPNENLPLEDSPLASNNNVDIEVFENALFFAWRTAPTHFASAEARIEVISSEDGGVTWTHESTFEVGADVREPRFHQVNGTLHFTFFEGGVNPIAFEPNRIWRTQRIAGQWEPLTVESEEGLVIWDVKTRGGRVFRTAYRGDHYKETEIGGISVFFERSENGVDWEAAGPSREVYFGGMSEVAFEFMSDGSLIAVGRVEDPDPRGMGTLLCTASSAESAWSCLENSDPERYDSPELFRHGDRLFMAARRDPEGVFGPEGDLFAYSGRPKRTSLYEIDTETLTIAHMGDLPGHGDTAFPAVRRVAKNRFLLANYTSPLEMQDPSWLDAQVSPYGTHLYLLEIGFE